MSNMNKDLKYDGWLKIYEVTAVNKNGVKINRELMTRASGNKSDDSVAGILYDREKELYYFVSQYRVGPRDEDRYLTEVVAGTVEKGEDPVECFKREAMEEVGFECESTHYHGCFYTSPGGTGERMHLYYSTGVRTSLGGGLEAENEDIEVIGYTKEELLKTQFKDLKTQYLINTIL